MDMTSSEESGGPSNPVQTARKPIGGENLFSKIKNHAERAAERRRLMSTPVTSDAENEPTPRFKMLESKISKLESRINALELFKLRSERARHDSARRRVEYKLRRAGDDDSSKSFKRPKVAENPEMY